MKRQRNTAYVYGKRFTMGQNFPGYTLEHTFNLPSTAAVLDGMNVVYITDDRVIYYPLFEILLNNEQIITSAELMPYTIAYNIIGGGSTQLNNNGDPYHATPRPLSGSDQVRVRFHPSTFAIAKTVHVILHFHYQPKR